MKLFSFKSFEHFASNESGMTLPMLALTFITITGFVGTAVDVARLQLVQSRLSFALDAAGLAAGSTFNTTELNAEVAKYLNANYPTNYLGSDIPSVGIVTSSNNKVIDLSASTKMPTTFMNIFGFSEMSVSATSQITRTTSGLELVMALDNTGSMNSSGKLTALKSAATSLINILYGDETTLEHLWVGLVPFSQTVNVGTGYTSWIDQTHFTSLNWGPTSWAGCVDARDDSSGDILDTPPTTQLYKAYFAPSTDNRPYPYNSYYYIEANKWITSRYTDGTPKTYSSYIGDTRGPNAYCPQPLTPMTANKNIILTGINSMEARGNTHVGLGATWAWNMLSPSWRGMWGGEMDSSALPLDYGTEHMNKALILLTDGANTMSSTIFTAYGFLSDGRLGTTSSSSTASATLNSKMLNVCTAMKNNGIYVYSIVLGDPSSTIKT
ncbi:MAG TPA: pilus assembly protein, partial [Rhodospirillaceae bacterium]|nr:pilus assembly protein [Rhodospirillaceae bacterium]